MKPNIPYEKYYDSDGNVAVLYSPGFGAGWYTWNTDYEGLVFDKNIVELVLANKIDKAIKFAEQKYPDIYTGGGDDLKIKWVPKGHQFLIKEHDGYELVSVVGTSEYLIA